MLSRYKFFSLSFFLANSIYFLIFSYSFAQSISCTPLSYFQTVGSKDSTNRGETTLLQKFLKDYFNLSDQQFIVSGYFGNITKKYVSDFQSRNNLPITGVVSVTTRKKILEMCLQPKVSTPTVTETNSPLTNIYGELPTPGKPIINIFMSTSTPLSITFNLQNLTAKKYVIDFGDRTNTVLYSNGLELSTAHEYKNYGNFKVTLYERYDCDYRRPLSCLVASSRSVGSVQVKLVVPVDDIGTEPGESLSDGLPDLATTSVSDFLFEASTAISPAIIYLNKYNYLYFAGTVKESDVYSILRINCDENFSKCREIHTAIDAPDYGFYRFLDPVLLPLPNQHSPGNSFNPDAWIMFMTGIKNNDGMDTSNTGIYFATSPENDINYWTNPKMFLQGYHRPATLKLPNGDVELFATPLDTQITDTIEKFNLGKFAKEKKFIGKVKAINKEGKEIKVYNPYVQYNPNLGIYQIYADFAKKGNDEVGYFTSIDGLLWKLEKIALKKGATNEDGVGSVTAHPTDFSKIIYTSFFQGAGNEARIKVIDWK